MKSFTVHERPDPPAERLDRAEELVFVKDGFNVFAAVLTPIWMLANRMWLVLFAYVVLLAIIYMIFSATGASEAARNAIWLALKLLVGFEADSLRRWTLDRKGWNMVGTVTGENADVCHRRFFEQWTPTIPAVAADQFGGFQSDPFSASTHMPRESNLGPVREVKPRGGGWFGGWRSS